MLSVLNIVMQLRKVGLLLFFENSCYREAALVFLVAVIVVSTPDGVDFQCCNHPNLFEPRSVESPMCVHQLRLSIPGLVLDLNEKEFGRDIPEIFDLRKRFTGVSSATVSLEPCSLSVLSFGFSCPTKSSLPSLRGP